MEIQFLASWDVEWKPPLDSLHGDPTVSAADGSHEEGLEDIAADMSQQAVPATTLTILPNPSAITGSIASAEDRLLRFALLVSKQDLTSLNGKECHGEACPTAGSSGTQYSGSAVEECDISDIVKWDYRRGYFPLTPQALLRMEFDHKAHPVPPKYVFPAAVLLFVCTDRTEEEETAYQSLSREWKYWFDQPLSYTFLKDDPPLRLGLNSDEIEWCKVKLEYLVKQIKSESDRERLGLPKNKSQLSARAREAVNLLTGLNPARQDSESSPAPPRHGDETVTAPRAAAAASESVDVGDDIAEKEGGGNAAKKSSAARKRKQKTLQPDARSAGAPSPAKRFKEVEEQGGSPVKDEDKVKVRGSDGKTVSLKDGRIVAAGNDLKKQYPNTYRNADNTRSFYGKYLTLGEAFKLACLVQYGPTLPIETSGHISMRLALFRTAAYYALSDEEEAEITANPTVADFLYFLVKSAKQIVYTIGVESRLIFGDSVFSRHPPARLLRGISNIISVHYAVTVLSNPLFSMQSIWAWKPRQPSWIARIG
jgi:hypothetical protein